MVIGVGIVFRAHSSQLKMCTSVPQIPVLCTFTRTSSGPICGNRLLFEPEAGSGFSLTRARMGSESRRWKVCGQKRVQRRDAPPLPSS